MKPKTCLIMCLICCLSLLMVGCSLTRSGKAARQAEQVKKAEQARVEENTQQGPGNDWKNVGSDLRNVEHYFDTGSITQTPEGFLRIWRKRIFPEKSAQQAIISLDEIDCRAQKYRTIKTQVIQRDGTLSPLYLAKTDWIVIFSESAEEYFLDNECKQVQPGK
jgi:hypothetical protein